MCDNEIVLGAKKMLIILKFNMLHKDKCSKVLGPHAHKYFPIQGSIASVYNITQQHMPLYYNSGMMGVQSKFESPFIAFQAFHCYIPKVHKLRAKY